MGRGGAVEESKKTNMMSICPVSSIFSQRNVDHVNHVDLLETYGDQEINMINISPLLRFLSTKRQFYPVSVTYD